MMTCMIHKNLRIFCIVEKMHYDLLTKVITTTNACSCIHYIAGNAEKCNDGPGSFGRGREDE